MKETTLRFITIYCAITIPHFRAISAESLAFATCSRYVIESAFHPAASNVFWWHRAGRHLRSLATPRKSGGRSARLRRVLGTHTRARESRGGARGPENGREKNEGQEGGREGGREGRWRCGGLEAAREAEAATRGNVGGRGRGRGEASRRKRAKGGPFASGGYRENEARHRVPHGPFSRHGAPTETAIARAQATEGPGSGARARDRDNDRREPHTRLAHVRAARAVNTNRVFFILGATPPPYPPRPSPLPPCIT